ncbi:MAG TPA: TIGR03767 family metallophosphoesterase [Acidimicrobiales bacterium]|nr:TIGR03767 family metallophosphoesterase [Acidimicrobiales bacterium]
MTAARRTLLPYRSGAGGYRRLTAGPAEPHTVRTDLGGPAPTGRLRPLLAFAQVSDLHITDAQSPSRAEYLDRLADDDSPVAALVGPVGTYRAQEALTHHVAEAMATVLRNLDGAPVTGAPLAFAVATGDSADNAQANEIEASIGLLAGTSLGGDREIRPDSGDTSRWEGVGSADAYDPRYWHPDGTPPGEVDDRPRSRYGFPLVPGLLDAARRPFRAGGLGLPWHPVYGNHDCLVAGTVAPTPLMRRVARGRRKATGSPEGIPPELLVAFFGDCERANPSLTGPLPKVPWRSVFPDPGRDQLGRDAWLTAHDGRSARPAGAPTWYGWDAGPVRCLVLDTVNVNGGWQGSLDAEQLAWLQEELMAGSRRFLGTDGRLREHDVEDRLFVLFSHHPPHCLINPWAPGGEHRVLAGELEAVLRRFPNLVAWVNGHTHANTVTAHRHDPAVGGGWWEITTASHVDWPQQARVIELAEDPVGGTVVLACTVVDHAGLVDPSAGSLDDVLTLAGWSRELAVNDWQRAAGRLEPDGRGCPTDRNVILVSPVAVPRSALSVSAVPAATSSEA